MPNWINPATECLAVTKDLIRFRSHHDSEVFGRVILYWKKADQSRDNPRELIRWFGEGLALFVSLPGYIKDMEIGPGTSAFGVWIHNALVEAMTIANENRIKVTFDTTGPIFH
jgi:hypothetical protein